MRKKKPVIGLLATSNYMLTNDTFQDTYRYGNNYIKKIVESGGIPLLIPYVDEKMILESLTMCDGLLLPGGNRIISSAYEVIDYFYQNKKPILGICLGMQTLAIYSINKSKDILKPVSNKEIHCPVELQRENNTELAHKDKIKKNSLLFSILGEEEIMVNSVHNFTITEVGKEFKISAQSEDNLIEGIEYKGSDRFIIGVQFHPEILPQFNSIFKVFIEECQKRKK